MWPLRYVPDAWRTPILILSTVGKVSVAVCTASPPTVAAKSLCLYAPVRLKKVYAVMVPVSSVEPAPPSMTTNSGSVPSVCSSLRSLAVLSSMPTMPRVPTAGVLAMAYTVPSVGSYHR